MDDGAEQIAFENTRSQGSLAPQLRTVVSLGNPDIVYSASVSTHRPFHVRCAGKELNLTRKLSLRQIIIKTVNMYICLLP